MSWAFLRHLVVVVVIWKNQNFQNFQTIQAFYIHNGTWQNSLSTTFNTARAWWTQIWFTPLVSWKEGLEYVKSLAHSLKLWCLGWEHERRRHVVRRAESAPPHLNHSLVCQSEMPQSSAWVLNRGTRTSFTRKTMSFFRRAALGTKGVAGEVRSFNKQIFPDRSMIGQAYYIVLS